MRIAAGQYVIGSPDTDENHVAARARSALPEFWIDQYEVTNAQYKSFLEKTGRPAPPGWSDGAFPSGHEIAPGGRTDMGRCDGLLRLGGQAPANRSRMGSRREEGRERTPRYIPGAQTQRPAARQMRLPKSDTYPVGTLAFNKSPFGAYDMTGSVWQWVGEPYAPVADGYRVLRGGRHGLLEDMAYRQPVKPDDERFARVAGVRCAADRVLGSRYETRLRTAGIAPWIWILVMFVFMAGGCTGLPDISPSYPGADGDQSNGSATGPANRRNRRLRWLPRQLRAAPAAPAAAGYDGFRRQSTSPGVQPEYAGGRGIWGCQEPGGSARSASYRSTRDGTPSGITPTRRVAGSNR